MKISAFNVGSRVFYSLPVAREYQAESGGDLTDENGNVLYPEPPGQEIMCSSCAAINTGFYWTPCWCCGDSLLRTSLYFGK